MERVSRDAADDEVVPCEPHASPLRAAGFYTAGQVLGGDVNDDLMFVEALEEVGVKAESVDLAQLTSSSQGNFTYRDLNTGISRTWQLPDAALMYHGALAPENTGHLLEQMEKAGCAIINGLSAWQTMTNKWKFYELMRSAGVPTIPTALIQNHDEAIAAAEQFGWPMVFKTPVGTEGDDVYVISSVRELRERVTDRIAELGGKMIAQPFIESRIDDRLEPTIFKLAGTSSIGMRNDFRIMSLQAPGEAPQIIATFQRIAVHAEQAVNNVAKGSREVMIEIGDLNPSDQQTVLSAIKAMPEAQLVGWDLIGNPGERLIMEANSGPGLPYFVDKQAARNLLGPCANLVKDSAQKARARRESRKAK